MALQIPFDPAGLDPKVVAAFDDVISALQTWSGKTDGVGKWIDLPYDAGLYHSASGGAWTVIAGSHKRYRYIFSPPEKLEMQLYLSTTTTAAGMTNDLRIQLPPGFSLKPNAGGVQDGYNMLGVCQYNSGAISGIGSVWGGGSGFPTQIRLLRDVLSPSTNWPSGVTDLSLGFMLTIPVILT